ncbi:hypothetical protein COZ14_01420 [Candidatus Dojkabacteria bacterium CG_4_10_14_3_um_filter_Dojkabacteria_WS6_41_9]|uniref:Methyltransferase type 11 domain-containing protein n=1 Tax=Candidatus Dojkabacteria bacterium CG_4_10_14_0_2_um_filter_Dojkabacteria_WS6_41_15 TaxID=2014249 RepID=A0A2M7W1Z5_9BACT|nr:MAG: hypothetical protein COZ14_01420 [Candidatus Dojkabacteria bacterium CG_4_10_14_3_um_filter_Dojkabacteria_WS6_41_9]PJA14071.1 MAG: hypothetical protein COX64_02470 [Candidatus Dojkabacteria bacterium CG_4_10_14_0_2_um_filter_Dojkabacteria_WS6_41_15]
MNDRFLIQDYKLGTIPDFLSKRLTGKRRFGRSLDFGAGVGRNINLLMRVSDKVDAVEKSNYCFTELLKDKRITAVYSVEDFLASTKEYDVVIAWRVISSIIDIAERVTILKTIYMQLANQGKLYVSVRRLDDPWNGVGKRIAANTYATNHFEGKKAFPIPIHFYKRSEIVAELTKVGFSVSEMKKIEEQNGFGVGNNYYFAIVAYKN